MTPLYPFTSFIFGGYLVEVMNIDQQPVLGVVDPDLMNQSLDEAFDLASIQ